MIPVTRTDLSVLDATVGTSATRARVSRLRAASALLTEPWAPPMLTGSPLWLETRTSAEAV